MHLADAIELPVTRSRETLLYDRAPKNPYHDRDVVYDAERED